ncbi:murein L,D-transpeptidase family protein [Anaerobiospirillum succiniciproducens]|uniref:L,D-transpeptidase family protein n=1 Tax=Anaerobiospirillum succiniciproducens TaxID=13335 RepID=UPI0004162CDA|nr:L,D-transpeptidase family protein [Anaerobiospirillum succiniciproducens]
MFAVCGVLNLDENLHVLSLFLSNESMAIDQLSLFVSACARFTSRLGGGFKSKMMLMALLFICSNSFLGSAQAAIGDLFNRTEIKPYAQHASSETANLPATLYNSAVVDSVVEDYEYDYVKLNRISSLPLFPRGYRAPKYLVDKVVVYKQYHQMMLYKNNQVVRKYWIALSDRPQGHKIQEGDRRTPEGTYTLDYVKENSYYYRAFHISYPNPQDIANARKRGVSPGGMIMVHGQPPSNSEYHETVQRSDWTNGCIAILNPEMDEFISLVDPGTPIEIKP